jgi:hypothetical protein
MMREREHLPLHPQPPKPSGLFNVFYKPSAIARYTEA